MWGKFQKKSQLLINFEENEFFRTRNKFQKSFRNDVLPTDAFKNRQNRKGVVHKKVEMKALLEAVVG